MGKRSQESPQGNVHERSIMSNRYRKKRLCIFLTEDEERILNAKVKMSGIRSKSEYVRQLITDGFVYHIDFAEMQRYNFLLSNISNNVNQIAHRINETRSIYQTDIVEVKKEMKKLWQLQRSMLSNLPLEKQ